MISSDLKEIKKVEQRVLDELRRYNYDQDVVFAVKLALEEGLNNAIKHGNRLRGSKIVNISFHVDSTRTTITITDQGGGFDPGALADPTADENLEKPYGRGVMLMRAYMDQVRFNKLGNEVYMVKFNVQSSS